MSKLRYLIMIPILIGMGVSYVGKKISNWTWRIMSTPRRR